MWALRMSRDHEFRFWMAVIALLVSPAATLAQSALDMNGHEVNPLTLSSGKVVVLVFLRRDCPVSGRYAPVLQRISQHHADKAAFWLVYPDKTDSPAVIQRHLAEYGYHLPALRDPNHVLVRLGKVKITPEVAVFDREQQLVYSGRIDNWYVDLGRARPEATTHELDDAIRAAAGGKAVARRDVRGVGCYISDLE